MIINILGTDYEIVHDTKAENPKLEDAYGYCEVFSKKIVLDSEIEKENDKMTCERLDIFKNKVLRHEIIHAFFFESGLYSNCDFAENEELIDWIAMQFYKIDKAFKKAGCDK